MFCKHEMCQLNIYIEETISVSISYLTSIVLYLKMCWTYRYGIMSGECSKQGLLFIEVQNCAVFIAASDKSQGISTSTPSVSRFAFLFLIIVCKITFLRDGTDFP